MRKVALVFVLAVIVPSLVLAWLAVRSLRDQQFVLERQRSLLYQNVADTLARDAESSIVNHQREFGSLVESILAGNDPATVARSFDDRLRTNWPLAQVGFVVTVQGTVGRLISPNPTSRSADSRLFCVDNSTFLANRETAEVYWSGNSKVALNESPSVLNNSSTWRNDAPAEGQIQAPAQALNRKEENADNRSAPNAAPDSFITSTQAQMFTKDQLDLAANTRVSIANSGLSSANSFNSANQEKRSYRRVYPQQQATANTVKNSAYNAPAYSDKQSVRLDDTKSTPAAPVTAQKVAPSEPAPAPAVQGGVSAPEAEFSKAVPAEAEFQQLIGDSSEGILARFVNNKLNVLLWYRSPRDPHFVFGAQLALNRIIQELREPLLNLDATLRDDICVAVLDENARPVALSDANFRGNWRHPFVATEIGEELPHWEIAAYLINPARLTQSAHIARLTLGLLIGVLLLAIGIGSWLIVNDLKLQLRLARQKTDFVSNVSHELKTPLTSIRMFSELLAEGRVADPARQRSYLSIITAEAARLTRLINNVLDFSRLEGGEKKYNMQECDLARVTRETVESYRPHLENHGFKLECTLPDLPLTVRGDADALAQIIVNLLSNAEKYSDGQKEIRVEAGRRDGPLPCAEVRVLDRGLGVPRESEEKIFEKFFRAHDSLSSGIQGSGLGLTLARQIARAHGGDVVYERRDGGGSCFCLRLPIIQNPVAADVRRL